MGARKLVKSAMIAVLALMLFYRPRYVHSATLPQNSTDMLALIDFRQAIPGDPTGFFNSWNSSVDYCKWNGVTCSKTHPGRVRELHVIGKSLEGRISPSLGNLTLLKIINLSSNNLSGLLPDLNRLRKLQILNLATNSLQGLAPNALKNCSNLQFLNIVGNMLAGSIPPELGSLYSLLGLNLASNHFTGSIPSSLGNITQLKKLFLSDNQLKGSIPAAIFNHSFLQILDVNTNFLHMALPDTIGNTLPSLVALGLHYNMFQGQIPASLGNASSLTTLEFTSNNFSGYVPSSLGKLSSLKYLKLEQNKLEANDSKGWEFLDALGNCTDLQLLSLYDNQLQGAIPNSIGKLPKGLLYLELDKNNLSGVVPESIGNLTSLNRLILAQNNLGGPIGAWI